VSRCSLKKAEASGYLYSYSWEVGWTVIYTVSVHLCIAIDCRISPLELTQAPAVHRKHNTIRLRSSSVCRLRFSTSGSAPPPSAACASAPPAPLRGLVVPAHAAAVVPRGSAVSFPSPTSCQVAPSRIAVAAYLVSRFGAIANSRSAASYSSSRLYFLLVGFIRSPIPLEMIRSVWIASF
jgi:hypothetical protein